MNLYTLFREADLSLPETAEDREICGICTDSRRAAAHTVFICIKGTKTDGHDYAREAAEKGAAVVVAEHFCDVGNAILVVTEDTRRAAARLYDAWYGHPARGMKLIAVTGTNGKTSVTHMLRAIFEAAMWRCGIIGTVYSCSAGRRLDIHSENPLANMTTPDPEELYRILSVMAADGVEYVFMEATSHALALKKLDALFFEAAIFTNLTPDHLDFHKNMENYFSAKAQLFSMCRQAIINVDDSYGKRLAKSVPCPCVTCSIKEEKADFFADQIADSSEGTEYRLAAHNLRAAVKTPIPGCFTVMNTLEAAACATVLGISPSVTVTALRSLNGIEGRMERVRLGAVCDFSVFIDYAHTPDALYNLLMTARSFRKSGQRIVLLFGCGGDRDKGKRPVMGKIASELADVCIVTSDNSRSEDPRNIIREICEGMGDAPRTVIPERAVAIDYAIASAAKGDIILLAGKGHEEYEIDKDGKHPFYEKQLVRAAVLRYHTETVKCGKKEGREHESNDWGGGA